MTGMWRNRIIETRMVDASALQAHPLNPRRHPETQRRAVAGLLGEVGIVDSLTVYESAAYGGLVVLDGHLRQEMGGQWPVNVLDVTDAEAELILATFDFSTSLAELDSAALADLLGRVQMTPVEDDGVRELLAQLATHAEQPKRDVDAEPQVDRADELRVKWGTQLGQMWQLGEHRLICGDCTDGAVVERAMGGERAQLLMADPEYDDDMNWLLMPALDAIPHWLIMAGDRQHARSMAVLSARFNQFLVVYFRQFSWNLNVYIPLLQHLCIAHYRSESAKNYHLDGLHSVIECASKFDKSTAHPHAKHVEILAPLLEGFSQDSAVVLDLFSGSGTTMIACEQLGRKCRAVEISPAYVAVALQRYLDATGIEPRLLETECVSLA